MGIFSGEWSKPMSWKIDIPGISYVQDATSWFISDGGKYMGIPVTLGGLGGDDTRKDVDNAVKTGDWKPVYQNLGNNFKKEFGHEVGTIGSGVSNFLGDMLTKAGEDLFKGLSIEGILAILGIAVVGIIVLKKI